MTGWAAGDDRSLDPCAQGKPARIDFGRFKMPQRAAVGERLLILRKSIVERVEFFKPDIMGAEEPYWPPPPKDDAEDCQRCSRKVRPVDPAEKKFKTSSDVLQFLQRVYGVLACTAAEMGVPLETYRAPSWRTTALGHGFPIEPKKAMVLKAKQLGLPVETEDEADAIGIFLHMMHGKPANARAQGDLLAAATKRL